MPSEIYEVIAQGARYWFLFLMVLIVWRSFRWYRRDKRQAKKRRRLLPDAGYVGEMVVLEGGGVLKRGEALAVPCEGTLGSLRSNDLCVPVEKVSKRHLWFRFDEDEGLRIEPFRAMTAVVDGEEATGRAPVYMMHGSRLEVGGALLRLRLFAGFESTAHAIRPEEAEPQPERETPPDDENAAQQLRMQQWMQQWLMQQMAQQQAYQQMAQRQAYQQMMQNQAYRQWLAQQENMEALCDEEQEPREAVPEEEEPSEIQEPAAVDQPSDFCEEDEGEWPYMPYPQSDAVQEDSGYTEADFYEPDELDEDMTDAAQPPKSAYIGHDEAEGAKRRVWDRYLGGGRRK